MTVTITRSGSSRNRSGNEPRSTLGHSARYTTSRMTRRRIGPARRCSASPCSIASRRRSASADHEGRRTSVALVRARVGQLDARRPGSGGRATCAPERTPAELDLEHVAAVQADEPADRAREAQRARCPSACSSGTRDPRRDRARPRAAPPGGSRVGVDLGAHEPVAPHERARRRCRGGARSPRRRPVGSPSGPKRHRLGRAPVLEPIGRLGRRHVLASTAMRRGATSALTERRGEAALEEQALDERRGLRQRRPRTRSPAAPRSRSRQERAHASTAGSTIATCACATRAREVPHAPDVADALGHRDRAARVEQVEGVRALQHLVVGRQRNRGLEAARALALVVVEVPLAARPMSATSKL